MLEPRYRDAPWRAAHFLDLSSRRAGFPRASRKKTAGVLMVCPGLSFPKWSSEEGDQATTMPTFLPPFPRSNRSQDLMMLQERRNGGAEIWRAEVWEGLRVLWAGLLEKTVFSGDL